MRDVSLLLAVLIGVTLLGARAVLAASGNGEASPESLKILALALLNFIILVGVLWRYAWQPIKFFLFQRSEGIRAALTASQTRLVEAEREIAHLTQRLTDLDRETKELVALSKQQASEERARMEQRARDTAVRIREESERVAVVELERARQALREEAVALAASLAAELLGSRLGPEDDTRLVAEFTERVRGEAH